jgi:recombinational DNA repair ATPase RecF
MEELVIKPYSSISVEGFRGFKSFKIDDLSRVNLFFGRNNCGKTTLLEAVFAHAAGLNFGPFAQQVIVNRSRP